MTALPRFGQRTRGLILRRLPAQLVALLTLALFPLGIISLYQTAEVIEEARELNRASLMERTVAAGAAERELLQRARGAAEGLGTALLSVPPEECGPVLQRFTAASDIYTAARFHGADGRLICRSGALPPTDTPLHIDPANPATRVTVRPAISPDGQPAMRVAQPVETDGILRGYVSVSIPLRLANAMATGTGANEADELRIAVVNREGALLAASHGLESTGPYLPRDLATASLFELRGLTFDAPAGTGETRVFAVSKMIDGEAALVGSWPERAAFASGWTLPTLAPMVYPVAMWLMGMLVAWFGLQRQVLRHVTALRSAMRRYALGELRGGRLTLEDPPEELREAERAFNRMVLLLAQADAQREQDLRDKEVLLREVHHRVKNNLQLIGSIINMQARDAQSPETRRNLDSLRARVRGLATMHRTLSDTNDMATVDTADMVASLTGDIGGLARERGLKVETRIDPLELYPEQALPLSMLLAETMTNAVKHAGPGPDGAAWVQVTLTTGPGEAVSLEVKNTVGDPDRGQADQTDETESGGLGSRLIQAFEQQIGAQSRTELDGGIYCYRLGFTRTGFDPDA